MVGRRSKPADAAPVLIRVLEQDPLQALRILAILRSDGFEVEVYSGRRSDEGAGAVPERNASQPARALRGSILSSGAAEQDGAPPAHEGHGPVGPAPGADASTAAGHEGGQIQLVARIRAILHDGEADERTRRLAVGPFEIDRGTHRAMRGGRPVHLGPTEFRLFEFFLERPNAAQSRQAIRAAVWGMGAAIDERTIDVHVGRLRRAVARGSEPNPIISIRGVGYVFEPGPDATGISGRNGRAAPALQPSREQRKLDCGEPPEA